MRNTVKTGLVVLTVAAVASAPLATASAEDGRSSGGDDRRSGDHRDDRDHHHHDRDDRRGDTLDIVGLVDGTKLVDFSSDSTRTDNTRTVRGLEGDERLVGIDYRVQDGKLYGVSDAGGVYSITDRGTATKVKQLTVALQGTTFGVDFNPAANALRVISDTGQNLRQPFADLTAGTVMDGTLTNPPTPPATAGTTATGVTGAAYTNNDTDADTATTLYDLDTALDQISIQSPANAGSLAATGKLGVDAGLDAGFDIYSTVRDGSTVDLMAYAVVQVNGRYSLYDITLFSGNADRVGGFDRNVTDLAIPLNQL